MKRWVYGGGCSPVRTPPTTNPISGDDQLAKAHTVSSPVGDFIQKDVDEAAPRRGGQRQWAVLISGQDHAQFPELNSAASEAVRKAGNLDGPARRQQASPQYGVPITQEIQSAVSRRAAR
jgi:hypothetical protein